MEPVQHLVDSAHVVIKPTANGAEVEVGGVEHVSKLGTKLLIIQVLRILDYPKNLFIAGNPNVIFWWAGALAGEEFYADVAETNLRIFKAADLNQADGMMPRITHIVGRKYSSPTFFSSWLTVVRKEFRTIIPG